MESSLAWLLTYSLHSTVLLLGVWLTTRLLTSGSDAFKESLWKCALLGGLLTASLQTGLGIDPLGGKIRIDPVFLQDGPSEARILTDPDRSESNGTTAFPLRTLRERPAPRARVPVIVAPKKNYLPWVVLGSYLLLVSFLLSLLGLNRLRLGGLLARRTTVKTGPLPELLERLREQAGYKRKIELSESTRVTVPMALGIFRPEICLPARARTDLSAGEQECMLAHELAHLKRCDPLWLTLFRVMGCLFFFQPLNRLACAKWLSLAEYQCDAWAAKRLNNRVSLARCLTEVAGWMVNSAPAHSMAGKPSILANRVKRLLKEENPNAGTIAWPWLILSVSALIFITTQAAPGVAIASPVPDPIPSISLTTETSPRHSLLGELQALDLELTMLDQEIGMLQTAVRGTELEKTVGSLLDLAEERLHRLHARRDRVQALMRRPAPKRIAY